MTNDGRSPEEIEREIERDRAGLTDTLDDLQNRFSVESIARQFTDQFQKHGGDIGQSVSDAVKRNPIGLALTGIGIAWLMMGDKTGGRDSYDGRHSRFDRDDRYYGNRDYGSRDQNTGYPNYPNRAPAGMSQSQGGGRAYQSIDSNSRAYRDRIARETSLPSWARSTEGHDDQPGMGSSLRDAAGNAAQSLSNTASSAADATGKMGASVIDKAKDLGQSAVDSVQDLASAASDQATAFRDRLSEGTEHLSEEARQRVVEARERALEVRDSAMEYGRHGRDKAMDLFEDQPLIAGALAMAFGAAIGAALPRSQIEDAYMGEQSDDLFHEAEQIFAEEKEKLAAVAKAATDEVKDIAQEVKQDADNAAPSGSVGQAVADKARSSLQRVADAAETEAKKQDLGNVKKP